MNRIARAIDVGYGNTKFSLGEAMDGEILCNMFPSVAPKANGTDFSGGVFSQLNTIQVDVNGMRYQVGMDGMLAMPANGSRTLDPEFAKKDEYMALVRGAMHMMHVPHIDHLYLGLPVSTVETMSNHLVNAMVKTHRLHDRDITVHDCVVVPQPVGGLFDYGVRTRQMKQLQGEINLLIDPGFFTLDWVVTSGTKMIPGRSDAANNGGMAAILRSIGEDFVKHIKERDKHPYDLTESILMRMDNSLRTGAAFKAHGRVEDLTPFLQAGSKVVNDALAKMVSKVGSLADIDNVVMVGGASHFYTNAVKQLFPNHEIKVAFDSVYANVRGFQMMATRRAQQQALRSVA